MKRWLLVAVAVMLGGAFAVFLSLRFDPATPRYRRFTKPLDVAAVDAIHYNFLSPDPFRGGKVWLSFRPVGESNSYRHVLFDIERRRVEGELFNASAVTLTPDETKLLCVRRSAPTNSWREKLVRTIERVSWNHIRFKRAAPVRDDEEEFWLLDLQANSARPVGTFTQPKGFGSTFIPSPDGWSGFKVSHSRKGGYTHVTYLFDLRRGSMEALTNTDWAIGWWDNGEMILQTANRDFFVLPTASKTTRPLLLRSNAEAMLRQENIDAEFNQLGAVPRWHHGPHQLYLSEVGKASSGYEPTFLALFADREPRLTLVEKEFEFQNLGVLDRGGLHYVLSPREMGECCNGVAVRDMNTKKRRLLFPANSTQPTAFPHFYGDTVIYLRSNALWQIRLDGSNNVRLFPP